jgi:small-conductance mechanosensitive channel
MGSVTDTLTEVAAGIDDKLSSLLPQLLGALVLLAIGWVVARLLRLATRRVALVIDSLLARRARSSAWAIGRSANLLGNIVYWVVLLFFITAATHALGLHTFTDWLARLLDQLPALAAGLLIVVAGYLASGFVADLVQAAATGLAPAQRSALARVAQGATMVLALLVGADQIGLKVTWIAILAAVLVATVMGGVTLAVSLGGRSYVANLIGAFYLRQALRLGHRVRVAGHEGRIVDVTATSLVLETADGRVLLPARVYHDEAIVLLARQDGP